MTAEFRLVLCEPAVAARVKQAVKAKSKRGSWQGPLNVLRDEWSQWYNQQRGVTQRRMGRKRRETSQAA